MTPTATKTRVNTLIDKCSIAHQSMNAAYQHSNSSTVSVDIKLLDEANKAMTALEERRLKQGPVSRIVSWLMAARYYRRFGDPWGDMRKFNGDLP